MTPIRTSAISGRYAHTVRIATPQGSVYDGQTGIANKAIAPDTILVRFPSGLRVPFGRGELVIVR